MIYPYYPNLNSKVLVWTKVYFIIIFACVNERQQPSSLAPQQSQRQSLCLEKNVNNLNDVFGILGELKKASSLFPDYVSNISYEAYTDDSRHAHHDDTSSSTAHGNKTQYYLTVTTLVSILTFVLIIMFLLAVLIRQQQNRIKTAGTWFPPIGPISADNVYSRIFTI